MRPSGHSVGDPVGHEYSHQFDALTWELPQWNSPPYRVKKGVGLVDGLSLLVAVGLLDGRSLLADVEKGVIGLFVTAG